MPSPSSKHLPADLADALRRGRAIPLLVDYRLPEASDFTLTVIGTIDDVHFHGLFLPDDYAGEKLIRMNVPSCREIPVTELTTDSADAKAIHELWSLWQGGGLESYLQFMGAVAVALRLEELRTALEAAEVLEPATTPASNTPGKKAPSKNRKKRSVPPAAKKGGRKRRHK